MSGLAASVAAAVRPRLVALTAAALVLVGSFVVLRSGPDTATATVLLPRAVHLYVGSDVVVLGVRVGEVTGIRPDGEVVRVELRYDADRRLPADVQAVLVSPTLVADRYVQLAPVYRGGPTLEDGATIPLARTGVPVELDEVFGALTGLADALGPDGANRTGALADLVAVAADTLDGNGAAAGEALKQVSQMTRTLADSRQELFGTVENLQALTTELAERDAAVRSFSTDLATVSGYLAGERGQLAAALQELALALDDVSRFLRDNREALAASVEDLGSVADALATERENLGKVLDIAPTGISNFAKFWDPTTRSLTGRINGNDKYESPAYFLCSLIAATGTPAEQCPAILGPLADVPLSPPSGAAAPAAPSSGPPVGEPRDLSLAGLLMGGVR